MKRSPYFAGTTICFGRMATCTDAMGTGSAGMDACSDEMDTCSDGMATCFDGMATCFDGMTACSDGRQSERMPPCSKTASSENGGPNYSQGYSEQASRSLPRTVIWRRA